MAPIQTTIDYYEYLDIAQHADDAQIKASYRRLAKLYHPDRNQGNDEAKVKSQQLHEAYSTLIDSDKRRQYNIILPSIRAQYGAPKSPPGGASTAWTGTTTENTTQSDDALLRRFQEQLVDIDKELQALYQSLNRTRSVLQESQGRLDEAVAALMRLGMEDKKDKAAEASENGWYNYVFGKKQTPAGKEAEKEARDRRQTERRLGCMVHEARRTKCQGDVDRLQRNVRELETKAIKKEEERSSVVQRKQQRQDATREAERQAAWHRQEEEARRAKEASRKAREEAWKAQQEERRAREEESRKAQEEMQRHWEEVKIALDEADRKRREAGAKKDAEWAQRSKNIAATRAREAAEAAQSREKAKAEPPKRTGKPRKAYGEEKTSRRVHVSASTSAAPAQARAVCKHKQWWSKVDGMLMERRSLYSGKTAIKLK